MPVCTCAWVHLCVHVRACVHLHMPVCVWREGPALTVLSMVLPGPGSTSAHLLQDVNLVHIHPEVDAAGTVLKGRF